MVCFDDVIQVLRGAMPRVARQLAFSLQLADHLWVRAERIGGDQGPQPVAHGGQCFTQKRVCRTRIAAIYQQEVDQPAVFYRRPKTDTPTFRLPLHTSRPHAKN